MALNFPYYKQKEQNNAVKQKERRSIVILFFSIPIDTKNYDSITMQIGMKRKSIFYCLMFCLVFCSFWAIPTMAKIRKVTINKKITIPDIGKKKSITVKGVIKKYKNSARKIVKITRKKNRFTFKGLKKGTSTITIKTIKGTGKNKINYTYRYKVKVKSKKIPVSSFVVRNVFTTIEEGETFTMTLVVTPSNATNKKIVWTSSNPNVASVNGLTVKGISEGDTTITGKTTDGSGVYASFNLHVKKAKPQTIPVAKITIGNIPKELVVGESFILSPVVTPTNATNKMLSFTSSNPDIAKVDSEGKITGISVGEATITIKAKDGSSVSAQCPIHVTEKTKE